MIETTGGDDGARTRDLRRDRKNVSKISDPHTFGFKRLVNGVGSCFSRATVGATVRPSGLFLWDFDFAIDQLYRLLTKLREEMLVPFQRLALMAGMFGNHVVRYSFS